jgi:hypothetical protein
MIYKESISSEPGELNDKMGGGVYSIRINKQSCHAMLQFLSPVVVSPFGDGDNWRLVEKLDYQIYETPSTIILKPGFVTDFASIPRPFWSLLPTWGQYGPASIVHDFLYWDQ